VTLAEYMKTYKRIPILILLALSIAPAISSAVELWEFMDPGFRYGNAGHICTHPSTAAMSTIWVILPVLLLLCAIGKRTPNIIAIILLLYLPCYLFYGTYFHPEGYQPSWWAWLVILAVTVAAEAILVFNLNEINIKQPTRRSTTTRHKWREGER
jgi:hypothetical protein